ncbi:hypothetical protein PGT21_035123 [Puccinia graminis f. sp. tritici]|uniref:Uncharacterized protein n=1 Tax=Puccinia graminis f. sp. tritici TaxID=56615 RepID=A0A5B0MHM0_PUCGR|nr:hypothetical protein PGTUg99_036456 [Puccinia graminis f. sp. tritici]KAA1091520.1 hypothetical protein PGT21_035123 [Puccinia graminis f. sp. tritici]
MSTKNAIVSLKQRVFYSVLGILSIGASLSQALPVMHTSRPHERRSASELYQALDLTNRKTRSKNHQGGSCLLRCFSLGAMSTRDSQPPKITNGDNRRVPSLIQPPPNKGLFIGGYRSPSTVKRQGARLTSNSPATPKKISEGGTKLLQHPHSFEVSSHAPNDYPRALKITVPPKQHDRMPKLTSLRSPYSPPRTAVRHFPDRTVASSRPLLVIPARPDWKVASNFKSESESSLAGKEQPSTKKPTDDQEVSFFEGGITFPKLKQVQLHDEGWWSPATLKKQANK